MKKFLLSASLLLIGAYSFAQVTLYKDGFTNDVGAPTPPFWQTGTAGIVTTHTAASGVTTLTGDGTSSPYLSITYSPYNNPEMTGTGSAIAAIDMSGTNNDSIFIIARSTVAGTELRVDLQDATGYTSNLYSATTINNKAIANANTYTLLKYSYLNPQDGAYGGPCAVSGCVVDKANIARFIITVNQGVGLFNGVMDIDYFQAGGNSASIVAALKNKFIDADLTLYPNPSTGKVVVNNNTSFQVTGVKVLNSSGVEVFSENGNLSSVELSNLDKGLYFMKVETDGGSLMRKIVIQ
jgi:hypothetical protein